MLERIEAAAGENSQLAEAVETHRAEAEDLEVELESRAARRGSSDAASPSPSEHTMTTRAPRARTSCTVESVLSRMLSSGTMATTGVWLSMSAIGPCFISAAG